MAKAEHVTGYVADFCPPLEKKHECPVCLYALRDPIQTACGHRFCTSCIKQILERPRPRCPLDNEQLSKDEIFPDMFCRREVLSLTVRCNNKASGCEWLGALKELDSHDKSCGFATVSCPNEGCQVILQLKDLAQHQENDCRFRTIRCAICGSAIIFSQQREHFTTYCPEIEIECENGCGTKTKRREMPEHLAKQCVNVKTQCPYILVGCTYEGTRSEVERHRNESQQSHMDYMLKHMIEMESFMTSSSGQATASSSQEQLKSRVEAVAAIAGSHKTSLAAASPSAGVDSELMRNDITALAAQAESTVSDVSVLSRQFTEMDSIIQQQRQQIDDMHSIISELQESHQQLLSDMGSRHQDVAANSSRISSFEQRHIASQGKVTALEQRQMNIEKGLAVKDNLLADHDVRLLSLEMTSYDGILRWKITEFNRRRSEAIACRRLSMYSPPFFTSQSGYKMCARIYLNGDGMGKGTHISLFFVVMKSQYDALLPWPFQQRVTFTLIDQEHRHHVSDTFQPDPTSSSFQRPVGEMNVASGCPLFVPFEALETHGYIKDDTMFIRVAVDTKGLVHP